MGVIVRVFQTFNRHEAKYIAHITQDKGKADLCAYLSPSRGLAHGETRWFLTNSRSDADAVFFFGAPGISNLFVFFSTNPAQAGWQKPHPLKGRL